MAKVIIIDDDPFILDMYVLKFKERGFDIATAHDGKEGLKKAQEFKPDAILLDVVMPALDGFDVLQELKQGPETKDAKIILLTNLGQKEEVERGTRLGADDYIIKAHFTPSEVVEKVQRLLEK
ncbi:MAG: response regulator [Candidatus Sungbacteria bacterium]|nr:response regulator [Candidatus Sungbacteria bacterium]